MTEAQAEQTILYGRPGCPMVPPVRALLDEAGVAYTYLNIREDYTAAVRLREITGGHESVPTVVLPDGQALIEPGVAKLRRALGEAGLGTTPSGAATVKAGLMNPVYVVLALIGLALVVAALVSSG